MARVVRRPKIRYDVTVVFNKSAIRFSSGPAINTPEKLVAALKKTIEHIEAGIAASPTEPGKAQEP